MYVGELYGIGYMYVDGIAFPSSRKTTIDNISSKDKCKAIHYSYEEMNNILNSN